MPPTKPKSTEATCIRSYLFKVDARCNARKLLKLSALHAEWQRMLLPVGEHVWVEFLAGDTGAKSLSSAVGVTSVFGATPLVTSVKQCLAVAVEGQLRSWKSNLKRRITRLVMRSRKYAIDVETRHQLLWLNSMQLWLAPFDQQQAVLAAGAGKTKVSNLTGQASRLLARYVRAYILRFKPPRFDRLPLQVNQMSSVWAPAGGTRLDGVSHWLRISTLERKRLIQLPIRDNAYANLFQGAHALTFSIFPKNGSWYVKVCKRLAVAAPRPVDGPILGLDTGMTNLLATSQGAIFGQGFSLKLRRWDDRLQAFTKGLQGAGVFRLSSAARYRDFVRRMRGWLTGEVKGAVNRALKLGTPSTVVIKALTFSSQPGVLSKKMNRLVRRMGAGIFKQAFEQKAELQGFKLVEVNPAYTSQECSACGFISRLNRKGNSFKCVCCGKQAHADAQAGRNLVERFRQGRVCEYVKYTTLGTQGLTIWAARMCARIDSAIPGSSRHAGGLRNARAGLKVIKDQGSHLGPLNQYEGLLNRLSSGAYSSSSNMHSTS